MRDALRPPFWHKEPAAQISWRRILHGEQSFRLNRPLPAEATVRGHHAIVAVEDKGPSRGALVYTAQQLTDADSGEPLASLRSAEFLRDDGGCGGFGAPPALTRPLETDGERSVVVEYRRRAKRLCSTGRRAKTICQFTPTPTSRGTPDSNARFRMD